MFRKNIEYLNDWKIRKNRRPLIIRGARQVGKTYLVREFASQFEVFIEINFDESPEKSKLFEPSDVHEIIQLLEIDFNTKINHKKTLIFLDEIQAVPAILSKLRYFFEKVPELCIIAAGSLLDFTLSNYKFSMPVGRIEYMFMGQMTYEEFLLAKGEDSLVGFLQNYSIKKKMPFSVHAKCLKYLKHYFYVGGMPAAVKTYIETNDFKLVSLEHNIILQTVAADFSKYKGKADIELLQKTFSKIPQLIGRKLKYVNIDSNVRAKDLAPCLNLLVLAKIIYLVKHSSGNGLPLSSEVNDRDFKPLFLDIGLVLASLKLKLTDIYSYEDVTLVNSGALAEQFIGQHLLFQNNSFEEPELYYWNRESRSASSEIDYLISHKNKIIPVEVKSGKTGSLKSMQVFVSKKNIDLGIRFNADIPSLIETESIIPTLKKKKYKLLSLPMYLVDELPRILEAQMK
jgi:predicted AAA+ superfamily ATPase